MADSALEAARGGASPPPLPRRTAASPPPVPPPVVSAACADAFTTGDAAAAELPRVRAALAIASVAATFGFLGALAAAMLLSPPATPTPIAIAADVPVGSTEPHETAEAVPPLPATAESPAPTPSAEPEPAPQSDSPSLADSEPQDASPDTLPSPAAHLPAIADALPVEEQRGEYAVQPVSLVDPVATAAAPSPWKLPDDSAAVCEDGSCQAKPRTLGTSVEWASSVAEASQRAKQEEKLVFLIHVSGNFALPEFT